MFIFTLQTFILFYRMEANKYDLSLCMKCYRYLKQNDVNNNVVVWNRIETWHVQSCKGAWYLVLYHFFPVYTVFLLNKCFCVCTPTYRCRQPELITIAMCVKLETLCVEIRVDMKLQIKCCFSFSSLESEFKAAVISWKGLWQNVL